MSALPPKADMDRHCGAIGATQPKLAGKNSRCVADFIRRCQPRADFHLGGLPHDEGTSAPDAGHD